MTIGVFITIGIIGCILMLLGGVLSNYGDDIIAPIVITIGTYMAAVGLVGVAHYRFS